MGRRWKSWVAAVLLAGYGALTRANQAVSNVEFLRSIPGWHNAVEFLFTGARVLAGPAVFFGGAWLIILSLEALWTSVTGKRRAKLATERRNYVVTAQQVIEYIALRSHLSITFTNNHWPLAVAAFVGAARSGKIGLAARRPNDADVIEIPIAELASLEPLVIYIPRAETVTAITASPFALMNQQGDKICYESVLCDPSEVERTWPPKTKSW